MNQHQVVANWKGNMYFEADAPGGMVKLDASEDVGGEGKGNRSKPLMLASLAGCTGMDIALLVKKMRIEVTDISIEVTGYLTDEHPKIYHRVHVLYSFKGADIDREKMDKAVNLSFDKYCGVIAMFKSFAEVTKEIRYN